MDLAPFLGPTAFVDSEHPSIVAACRSLELDALAPGDRAVRIAEHVRASVAYQFAAKRTREEYVASRVLSDGRGFCVQKAVLACAIGRAAGVPSAVVLCDMRDASLPPHVTAALGTDVMFHHGINAFYVDDRWWRVDASLSPEVLGKKDVEVLPFSTRADCLLPASRRDGRPHAEYQRFHGTYAELPFEPMLTAFAAGYARADIPALRRMGIGA